MTSKTKLYRLLRDDENDPLKDGITAKLPLADKTPLEHIRYGSRTHAQSQWISTSRSLSDVEELIRYKRRKEGRFKVCKVVEIDEQKLITHENEFKRFLKLIKVEWPELFSKYSTKLIKNVFLKVTTGDILDFTDPSVMDKYIPKNNLLLDSMTARGFALRYREVLVGRHIPAECCVRIIVLRPRI